MALTITKSKSKTAAKKTPKSATVIQHAVERIAEIDAKLATLDPLVKERAALAKDFKKQAEDFPSANPVFFLGTKHQLEFSPCSNQRQITDMAKVRKLLGDKVFMELAKVTLADIDKYLSKDEQELVIVEGQTGSRIMKVKEIE